MTSRALLPCLLIMLAACAKSDHGLPSTELVESASAPPANPALSPDGGRLAWAQVVNGQAAIHVSNADGSSPVVLTHGSWDRNPVWSPDGRWIAYLAEGPDFDLMVVPSDGGEPRQLTSEPGVETPVAWLADGSGVVFYHAGAGDVQTLVAPLDGGPAYAIVPPLGGNQTAAISPDESKAVFDLHRGSEGTIWVQDLPEGKPRQLTTEGFENILPTANAWSPDNRHVAFESRRTGTWDIWVADVETGELHQVTHDVHNDYGHVWSPDGRWIAFISDRGGQSDVWIIPSGGGQALRVTNDLAAEGNVQWSPGGDRLLFLRSQTEQGIGVAPVEGGAPRMLVDWPGYTVGSADLSPSGETVLFTSNRSGNSDIWSVPFAGGEPKPFAVSPLSDSLPRFSPDGTQVLFTSDRSGSQDLWVMPAAGGEARRLTDWPSDETRGRWSPDGSQIAFVSNYENTKTDVWLVPSAGGTPTRLTARSSDIAAGLRWSPDGHSVYVMVAQADGRHALYRVPIDGGSPEALPINPDADAGGDLSRDGTAYAYSAFKDGWAFVEVIPTAGGAPHRLTRRTERVYQTRPVWSPDGTHLAVEDEAFGDDPTNNVLVMGVSDTTRREVTTMPRSHEWPVAYAADGRQLLFVMQKGDGGIVSVSVAALLAGAGEGR